MYDREYNGKKINFEASGGLMHASLVMQDFETDSYWAIMKGESVAGEFKGTRLVELPYGKKMRWDDWAKEHPNTLVLSVDGREDGYDAYRGYFTSSDGFSGIRAKDSRLKTKEPIFAFRLGEQDYAIPYSAIEGGKAVEFGDASVFLYRPKGAEMFRSTTVYKAATSGFKKTDGVWLHEPSGCKFDPRDETFVGESCPQRFEGFDTFWYNWSLSNPGTKVLD